MASTISRPGLLSSSTKNLLLHSWRQKFHGRRPIARPNSTLSVDPRSEVRKEDIVIVGGGIAGLATAVGLHRVGIGSTVLEQGETLRTGGTSLTLSKNGWKVLDDIGVAHHLRPLFLPIERIVMKSEDGRVLRSLPLKDADPSQELRPVERRILLETLANQLPSGAISFSKKLQSIGHGEDGDALLQLHDGTQISAKIVIACDGVGSPVAKWMGFAEPKYVGYCAFRGLGVYPNGQPFEPGVVNYVYGRGVRAGFVPLSPTKVYWFITYNSSSPGPWITDPSVLRQQAQELLRNYPSELLKIVDQTADDTLVRNPLMDRWLWPAITPPGWTRNTVLLGDSWHPMTPNLGQGACCALEDALVLTRKLTDAIKHKSMSVEEAFKSYCDERWRHVFPLTIKSNIVGRFFQWDNKAFCSVRNNIILPKLATLRPAVKHTNFEGRL